MPDNTNNGPDLAAARLADQKDHAARTEDELTHRAELATAQAQEDADRAQHTADQLGEQAEALADDIEPTVTVDLGERSFSKRIPGGGQRRYGPGKVKVPKSVADYIKSNPTFATSGNRAADKDVRAHLERNFGHKETVSQDVIRKGVQSAPTDSRAAQGRKRSGGRASSSGSTTTTKRSTKKGEK